MKSQTKSSAADDAKKFLLLGGAALFLMTGGPAAAQEAPYLAGNYSANIAGVIPLDTDIPSWGADGDVMTTASTSTQSFFFPAPAQMPLDQQPGDEQLFGNYTPNISMDAVRSGQ